MFNARTTDRRFDDKAIKANTDMLALVENNLGPCHRHNGQWHFWPCPFHTEKTASFAVNPQTRSWRCFGTCHKSGNAIEWVMAYKKVGFKDSCRYLEQFIHHQPPVSAPRPPLVKVQSGPIKDVWQHRATILVNESQNRLWNDSAATDALVYLRQRGFSDNTIRNAHLGYNINHKEQRSDWGLFPNGYDIDYMRIDSGIVIPFFDNGTPRRITIRRFPKEENTYGEEQKYKILSGSANTLYNSDLLDPTRPAMLTEGVFDALSVQQEAGDLIVAVATDSTGGARTPESIEKLAALSLVLVAYDADTPGDTDSEFWLDSLPNAKRWRPLLDDPNAMLQKGLNIRQWVADGLH